MTSMYVHVTCLYLHISIYLSTMYDVCTLYEYVYVLCSKVFIVHVYKLYHNYMHTCTYIHVHTYLHT